jgi:hypothetical protein
LTLDHDVVLLFDMQANMSNIVFSNTTITLVVQEALETQEYTLALKYLSSPVKKIGTGLAEIDHSFQELLLHATNVVTSQSNLLDAMELLQVYFECLQRYILYCPRALCHKNPQFATMILTLGV